MWCGGFVRAPSQTSWWTCVESVKGFKWVFFPCLIVLRASLPCTQNTLYWEVNWYMPTSTVLGCVCVRVWVAQLCPTLWDPMDYSPQGSSVHGILQARSLWWVAAPCSDNPWKRHFAHLLLPSCSNLGKERGVWGGGGLEGRNLCKFCKYLLKGESKFRLMLWKWVLDKDQNPVWSQSGFIKMQIFQTKQDVAIASGSGSLKAYWGHFLVYIM